MKNALLLLFAVMAVFSPNLHAELPASLPVGSYEELRDFAFVQVDHVDGNVYVLDSAYNSPDRLDADVVGNDKVYQITSVVNEWRPEVSYFSGKDVTKVRYYFGAGKKVHNEQYNYYWTQTFFEAAGEVVIDQTSFAEKNAAQVIFRLVQNVPIYVGSDATYGYVVTDNGWTHFRVNDGYAYFPSDFAGKFSAIRFYGEQGLVGLYGSNALVIPRHDEIFTPRVLSVAGVYSINLSVADKTYGNMLYDIPKSGTKFGRDYVEFEVRSDSSTDESVGAYVYVLYNDGNNNQKGGSLSFTANVIQMMNTETGESVTIDSHPDSKGWFYIQTKPGEVWRGIAFDDTLNAAPVLTMAGSNPQPVMVGGQYVEYGVTAEDLEDGDITQSVVVDSSQVDTHTVGVYLVTYTVTDSQGRETTVTRTVNVYENGKG